MRRQNLGKWRQWAGPAAASLVIHLAGVAAVYFSADALPGLQPQAVPRSEAPALELTLDVDVAPHIEERSVAVAAPYDPAVAHLLAPVVERPATVAAATPSGAEVGNGGPSATPTASGGTGQGTAAPVCQPSRVSWFPEAAAARSVVFVIDRSGSMGRDSRFRRACVELERVLSSMPADVRFQVIVYNRFAERLPGPNELLPATAENKRRAADWLATLGPEGGTDSLPAMRQAVALGAELIYLLTDGDDFSAADVQAVTKWNRGRSVIHTLSLAPGRQPPERSALAALAHANGGARRCVGD